MDKTGGPAFPESTHPDGPYGGMTLRDYFAAKAMAAMWMTKEVIASTHAIAIESGKEPSEIIAMGAYQQADRMLAQREKEGQ